MIATNTKFGKLERIKTIFMETGMIITLILVLFVFNWKTYNKSAMPGYYRPVDNTPVEMAPVTIQKPPEPPKMNKPVVVHTINIVDNETLIDEDYIIDAEADPMDSVPEYIYKPVMKAEEPPVDEKEIFKVVESMPEFPGGYEAMYKFLQKNLVYPEMAKAAGISGKVYITFVVEKDGSITDVQLMRGIGGGCDEEALRVVGMMPAWKPGLQRNHPVRVQFIMDVKFILQGI